MLWDEPKIFFLERRYFFSIILSEFLKNRVALHRAFDIATIYTFLRSRPHQTLSPEELHILTDFKIDFIGMSDERRTILRDMKEETLRLAQSRG